MSTRENKIVNYVRLFLCVAYYSVFLHIKLILRSMQIAKNRTVNTLKIPKNCIEKISYCVYFMHELNTYAGGSYKSVGRLSTYLLIAQMADDLSIFCHVLSLTGVSVVFLS